MRELERLRNRVAELEVSEAALRRAEEELLKERSFNRSLIQTSPAFIVALDPDGKTIMMNDAMLTALGFTSDEATGADYLSTFVPEYDRERRAKTFERIVGSEQPTVSEATVLTKDGREIPVAWHGRPVFGDNGELEFFFGVGIDITDLKRADEALQKERDEAQSYLDVAGVVILGIARDETVTLVNAKGCEILDVTESEIIGRNWFDNFLPKKCRGSVRETFQELMASQTQELEYAESEILTSTGKRRTIAWHNTVVRSEDGQITGTLSSGIDVTEARRAEEVQSVIYSIADAVHTTRDVGELIGTIRHELGWILNTDNFFIALYDRKSDTISLPYFVDEKDQDDFDSFPAGKTLTAYVIHNDRPLLATRAEMDRMVEEGLVDMIGTPSQVWLGVPVKVKGEVIGAVVVQSYVDESEFGERDLEILTFVSGQIGLSIERKRDQEELRFLGMIPTQVSDGIMVTDLEFKITYVNKATEAMFGYAASELIGQTPDVLNAEDAASSIQDDIYRTVASGRTWTAAILNRRKDGTTFICECRVSPLRDQDGRITSYLAVVGDVTERKRTEQLLQTMNAAALEGEATLSTESVFSTVVSKLAKLGVASAILRLGDDGSALSVEHTSSARGATQSGLVAGEDSEARQTVQVTQSAALEETVNDRRAVFVGAGDNVLARFMPAQPAVGSGAQAAPRGARQAILAPLVAEDKVFGVLALSWDDMTERDAAAATAFANQLAAAWRKAKLLQELRESIRALEETQDQLLQAQKMEAVGKLAGGVAHDFNNLLTAIMGYTDIVLRRLGAEDPAREDISQIKKAAEQAASLTSQLLAFSRRQALQPMVLSLNTAVTDMEKMLRRVIGENIELLSNLDPELGYTKADPAQIQQVIMNLAVNARDAMPDGGRLTVGSDNVTLREADCRYMTGARPGDYVRLSFEDTGIGMDKETIARIFEPFFTTKGPGKGTGLGLSVVYGIARQHDGWISVYSEPGVGSTFKVYLPATFLHPSTETGKQEDEARRGAAERILLVEDEDTVRDFAKKALLEGGYVVVEAETAEKALELFEREIEGFDLVFSDVVLPGRSGVQLAEELLDRKPELRVLLSSGYTDLQAHWPIIRDRGFPFLQKPYALGGLLEAVGKAIEIDRPADWAGPH